METRNPLNARVWRLVRIRKPSKEKKHLGHHAKPWVETDWKVGQVRWAKIAEPRPNAPYCAALCHRV